MAKIVPHDPEDFKRTQCEECFVKIEYAPDEVTSSYQSDYGGGGDTYYWIRCPRCGKDVQVSNPLRSRK